MVVRPLGTKKSCDEIGRLVNVFDLKAALPLDAVLINVHGAMVADGYDDCEGDLLQRARAILPDDAPQVQQIRVALAECRLDLRHTEHVPALLERRRRLVQARALAETAQIKPALDLLTSLDGDDVDVDQLSTHVQRAAELIELCRERISSAKLRIEEVVGDLKDE